MHLDPRITTRGYQGVHERSWLDPALVLDTDSTTHPGSKGPAAVSRAVRSCTVHFRVRIEPSHEPVVGDMILEVLGGMVKARERSGRVTGPGYRASKFLMVGHRRRRGPKLGGMTASDWHAAAPCWSRWLVLDVRPRSGVLTSAGARLDWSLLATGGRPPARAELRRARLADVKTPESPASS